MTIQSPLPFPFSAFENLFGKLGEGLQPPPWMVHEVQHRAVLLLNHVLQQETEAQNRLARQKGRVVQVQWRAFHMRVAATPAGLLELAAEGAPADLTLTVTEESPWQLGQAALRGDKPPVSIAGDVQLAAEVNWLVDNVRWDLEEDLSRVVGDAPAHAVGETARRIAAQLRQFVARRTGEGGTGSAAP